MKKEEETVYDRFHEDFKKHKPCPVCEAAKSKDTMCWQGRMIYMQMLSDLKHLKQPT